MRRLWIAGYFCLSAGDVRKEAAPTSLITGAPQPIPVIRMGRFAIAVSYHGQGWAADLLREALLRAVAASELIGGGAMLVDALNHGVKQFYLRFGFEPSPLHPQQLLCDLATIARSAGAV
jgi:GNAT superfamily N-acetyltransferase